MSSKVRFEIIYFDFRKLQLVEHAAQIVDLFIKFVPNLALRVLEIRRQFVLEPRDFLAAHSASDKCHYHNDITQPERDPTNQKYLIHDKERAIALRIILA